MNETQEAAPKPKLSRPVRQTLGVLTSVLFGIISVIAMVQLTIAVGTINKLTALLLALPFLAAAAFGKDDKALKTMGALITITTCFVSHFFLTVLAVCSFDEEKMLNILPQIPAKDILPAMTDFASLNPILTLFYLLVIGVSIFFIFKTPPY